VRSNDGNSVSSGIRSVRLVQSPDLHKEKKRAGKEKSKNKRNVVSHFNYLKKIIECQNKSNSNI
jgi:hypothetical protein